MRSLIKKFIHPAFKKVGSLYHSKERIYKYNGIEVIVHPKVFPPHLTLSTKIILDFIKPLSLKGKTFLELGCGSGIVSLFAKKKGAIVTAIDINQTALEYLEVASKKNHLKIEILFSDLFNNLENRFFDYILINPPYYPKAPADIEENAWFCGENFEYFNSLFNQLKHKISKYNNVLMILSEDCQIDKIKSIAWENDLKFELIHQKRKAYEMNYIFKIVSSLS